MLGQDVVAQSMVRHRADRLSITEGVAKKHISNFFGKLDLPGTIDGRRRVPAVLANLDSGS